MKKQILFSITLLAFMLSFLSCQKEEDTPKAPKVTEEYIEVSATAVTFTWTVDWLGKFASVVEVSENEDMSDSQTFGNETETDDPNYKVKATGLKEATDYYYRFLIWNQYFVDNKFKTNVKSFTTKSGAPKVKTTEVTDVTRTTATVICEVTDDSGATVTERGVCWDATQNPTVSGNHSNSGTGTGTYSVALSDLTAGQKYYVRAYAVNENGTAYGDTLSFVTLPGPPVVTTSSVTNITATSAVCGGEVKSDGGCEVTERGVCWSVNPNPGITDSHASSGTGTGSFTVNMSGLTEGMVYYVRAYATNIKGTSYGDEKTFYPHDPKFSVSSSEQVYFSKGNLQYDGSTGTWKFADHQWDVIGTSQGNSSQSTIRDLFGWGTSGWNCGNTYYRPYDTDNSDGSQYGPLGSNDLTGDYANSDWGVYNAISNGGNQAGLWRTLTREEWVYLFATRQGSWLNGVASARYAKAKVNDMAGVILFPDSYTHPGGVSEPSNINQSGAGFASNSYSGDDWNKMEQAGCVFLPAAGYRYGTSVDYVGSYGYYWSASYDDSDYAYYVYFYDSFLFPSGSNSRNCGRSVRLVRSAQ